MKPKLYKIHFADGTHTYITAQNSHTAILCMEILFPKCQMRVNDTITQELMFPIADCRPVNAEEFLTYGRK